MAEIMAYMMAVCVSASMVAVAVCAVATVAAMAEDALVDRLRGGDD